MEIKMIKPTDADYPLAMNLVPFAEKYELIKIDNLVVVPLFQVIDAISEVKADIVVHDGVECCPTCMKPIKGTFTKSDMVAMLGELQDELKEEKRMYDYTHFIIHPELENPKGMFEHSMDISIDYIQQKINALRGTDE